MFKIRKFKLGCLAFSLYLLIIPLLNGLEANVIVIRDENNDVVFRITENGNLEGTAIQSKAVITPQSNDLLIRTELEEQMLFTSSAIKIGGIKKKLEGLDADIADGLYFRNTEAEPNKQVQAALTETEEDLLARGHFGYKAVPLTSSGGKTNHPVLFVHGIWGSAATSGDITPFVLYHLTEAPVMTTYIKEKNFNKCTVKFNLKFTLRTSGGRVFDDVTDIELIPFTPPSGIENISVRASYEISNNSIQYIIYDGGNPWREGTVDMQRYFDNLAYSIINSKDAVVSDELISYIDGSAQDYLAKKLNLNTAFSEDNPSGGVNSNGLYFYSSRRAVIEGSTVKYWVLDGSVKPDWNAAIDKYGQANQLVDRMKEVLDNHYGVDAWKGNPEAVIDLVCHSQGGLVARLAAYHSNSQSLDNPINHINRIITLGTPHWGSAVPTESSRLRAGNPDDGDKKYPTLASTINLLLGVNGPSDIINIDKFLLPPEVTAALGLAFQIGVPIVGSFIDNLKVTGNILGPYTFSGTLKIIGLIATPFGAIPKAVVEVPLKFSGDFAKDAREELLFMHKDGQHLAWKDQPNSIIMKMVRDVVYPVRWSTNDPIYETHLHSPAARDFFGSSFDIYRPQLYEEAIKYTLIGSLIGVPSVLLVVKEIFNKLNPKLDDFKQALVSLDNEWCNGGDVVVETFSQKGVNLGTGFDPAENPAFSVKSFSSIQYQNKITHTDMTKLNPGYSWEKRQCFDIARELGVFAGEPEPPGDPGGYLPDGALAQSSFDSSGGTISILFTNNSEHILGGFTAEYYVTADSALQPELSIINGAGIPVTMEKCTGNIYKVLFNASGVVLEPGGTFPDSGLMEFDLSYFTGTPWNNNDDYSFIHYGEDETLRNNLHIVVRDTSGRIISGYAPDSAAIRRMSLPACVVFSKERADWNVPQVLTRPSLALENNGSSEISEIQLHYYFKTSSLPVLTVDLQEYADSAVVTLDTLGEEFYAVRIAFWGIILHPGDRIDGINFEISNLDAALWDFQDDPSFVGSDTLVSSPKILALGGDLNRIWGMYLNEIAESYGPFYVWLEASESSVVPEISRPRIRLLNEGTDTLKSFKIYYYFSTEDSRIPVCDVISAPGCSVRVENLSADQYRIVFECIDANIPPGEDYFPDDSGIIVELKYGDMTRWERSNDYSAEGLCEFWSDTKRIVVEDMSGKVLWGVKP